MKTGILGGTFDPIHLAHMHAAEVAFAELGLDRLVFVPAGDPWQKEGRDVSPAHHRLAMTRIAVGAGGGFEVDPREVERDGPSYTIDTLEALPETDDLFLVVGSDAAARIDTWHRHEDVLSRVTVAVAPRPGTDVAEVVETLPGAVVLNTASLDISATNIRLRVRLGLPCRYLLPEGVWDYVMEHGLYADPGKHDRVGPSITQEELS